MAEILQPQESEGIKHNCGIIGIYRRAGEMDLVSAAIPLLITLQHRGQEGAGLALHENGAWDREDKIFKGTGKVADIFPYDGSATPVFPGRNPDILIGQTRYSTSGKLKDAWQPFEKDGIVMVHNGTFTNAMELLADLSPQAQKDAVSDSWIALQTIVEARGQNIEQKLINAASRFEGAYSLIIGAGNALYALKDPWEMRPLVIGALPKRAGYVLASENAALRTIGARTVREVHAGEGVRIDDEGIRTFFVDDRTDPNKLAHCIFELFYFSLPDSQIFGKQVVEIRQQLGKAIATEDAKIGFLPDVIVPVQESGVIVAQGYAQQMIHEVISDPERFGPKQEDLPIVIPQLVPQTGLVKNMYLGRGFLATGRRKEIADLKHRGNRTVVEGKKVVVPEDSIVRGDTVQTIVRKLYEAGASEVHIRVPSPQFRHGCFWGIDFPTQEELIAHNFEGDVELIRKELVATSLRYLDHRAFVTTIVGEDRMKDVPKDELLYEENNFCGHCLTGRAPMEVKGIFRKETT